MKLPVYCILMLALLFSCESSEDETITEIEEETEATFSFSDFSWSSFNSSVFFFQIEGEVLTLTLNENAAWFNTETGGMYFMMHEGDFDFSATVATTTRDLNQAPQQSYSFGGLVARDPTSETENYVHVVTGTGIHTQTPATGYEYKITNNSQSDYTITHDDAYVHDLRLVRDGNLFSFYQRAANTQGNWILIHSTEQNLPSELQLGFTIYTAFDGAETLDMQVQFSNVNFQ